MTFKATIYCLTVTMLTVLTKKTLGVELDYNYTCPNLWKEPCKCATLDFFNTDNIQVHCQILNITPDYPDFSLVQSSHTTVLFVICDDYFPSELHNGMFHNLHELEELAFTNCRIKRLIPGAFQGLDQLRMLNMSFELPPLGLHKRNLTIEPNSFSHLSELELVSFLDLGIANVPKGLFCGLQHMKFIDFTGNELKNELEIGCINETFNGTCLPNLNTLGLARNQLKMLSLSFAHYTPSLQYLYLDHNMITSVSSSVLSNLKNLLLIQLAHNKLTEILGDIFKGLNKLEQVYLDSNQITCLAADLFNDNNNMTLLYLGHNKLSTNCLPKINHLNNLQELDLSYNQLHHLPNEYFQNFSKLKVLHLEGNDLFIDQSMFYSFSSLQYVNVSNNSLTSFIFNRDYAGDALLHLGIFDISSNKLSDTSLEIANFSLIPNLQQLWLQQNQLSKIPTAKDIKLMQLSLLTLESNLITDITSVDFLTFPLLQYFSLKNNFISYVPKRAFVSIPELVLINLSWNTIKSLEYQAFNDLPKLRIIKLNHNQITEIDLVFIFINDLQVLDLSNNLIRRVQENDLPPAIIAVDMSHNKINMIDTGVISKLPSLTTMVLSYNSLSKIFSGALIRSTQSINRPRVFLAGNYFFCDCNMYYMQDINKVTLSNSRYVIVPDLSSVICHSLTPGKQLEMLTDLNPEDFLCNYCPSTRPGCETSSENYYCYFFDCPCSYKPESCHCCQFCPDKCVCSRSGNAKYNRIDCMNKGLTKVPETPLPLATHVCFDGNHISSLLENDFRYQSTMKVLYLNNSEIQNISTLTFQNLSNLESLYLKDNLLMELKNQTFLGLEKLNQLFLQKNTISHIEIKALEGLTLLKELHLENNNLSSIDLDIFDDLDNINSYYLANNPWHCDCQFGPKFQTWITRNSQLVHDMPVCETLGSLVQTNSSTDYRVTWIDFDPCKNLTTERIVRKFNKAHIPIIIGIIITFILLIIGLLLIYRYRDLLQVWLYTNYGIRFHKVKEDEDKDYDAFISYSSSDESYVVHELVPMLEEGNPPYKTCVHYRDWIIGNGIADSVISSVYSSRRTILLLSRHFIQSEWCNYEFQTAHHQVLKDKTCRLIVVLMEDEPPEDLDEELQLYIQSHTYIRRSDPWFYERLKYALPEVSEEQRIVRWEAKRREKEMLKQTREAMIRLNISNVPPLREEV